VRSCPASTVLFRSRSMGADTHVNVRKDFNKHLLQSKQMGGVKSRCISNDRLTPLRAGMFGVVVYA